jgi:hypothetical protein
MGIFPDTKYIQLQDSRKIAYCEYGDPNGRPVFYFHGTPGSRHEPFHRRLPLANFLLLIQANNLF